MSFAMDSRVKSAPLTLLMGDAASGVAVRLRSLFEKNDEFLLSHAGAHNTSSCDIVYRGIALHLATSSEIPDMGGMKKIFCNLDPASVRAGIDVSLGEHVADGARVPAILQALLGAAHGAGAASGAVGAIWHPAQIVSGFDYFAEAVSDYLAGGAFPVLAMVNFKAGPGDSIDSNGLAFLAGQELQIATGGMDQGEIMRRVVRVVHDIAVNGPIREAVKLSGIEPGEILELQPTAEARLLRMNIRSDLNA